MDIVRRAAVAAVTNAKKNQRIKLNVGGAVFETWTHTLLRKPGTRLSRLARALESDESYDSERGEYFFDRHPGIFATVMHYYRTEELHTDHNICGNIIKGELEYWGLTELDIEPCCWGHYNRFKENKETLAAIDDSFTFQMDPDAFGNKPTRYTEFKKRVWIFLEDPASSKGAKIYAITSMFFVILSIGVFVLETHYWFRTPLEGINVTTSSSSPGSCSTSFSSSDTCCCRMNGNDDLKYSESEPHDAMTILDYISAGFFTIEYLGRFYFAPRKCQFLQQPLNIIDILCLLPHFVSIIMKSVDPTEKSSQVIKTVLALRIIRVLRIFKLMKHYTAFKILVYTIKVSTKELLLMVIFLFTGVLLFASVIFYAENSTFTNIPIGFWWALVTMTTVGYGDKVPRTEAGYLIGSMCVLCGVLTVAFTVPIVVNNFTLYYSHAQSRVRLPPPKKEELQKKLILKNQKAQEFIHKLTENVKRSKTFYSLNTPRNPDAKDDNPSIDSGLPDCSSPVGHGHKTLQSTESTSTMCSMLSERQSVVGSPNRYTLHNVASNLHTVSASVAQLELELPGTPAGDPDRFRHPDTTHLLNTMEDHEERMELERRRQQDMVSVRIEQKRQRLTPRPPGGGGGAHHSNDTSDDKSMMITNEPPSTAHGDNDKTSAPIISKHSRLLLNKLRSDHGTIIVKPAQSVLNFSGPKSER
ncbi:potassium voltage-gated channel protein Shaw-like [Biomphalaria glabrata]|uniref:Potassium voltage-gated channel protein Shaw-like n=2 Tax=Biomphalaria TaxID=6525 RepID=A0A2C9K8G6_BIOGL|nr:potassium voltage-gated channel protein Shaw-like [Biomphalaria glabrata]KAI8789378.1 potassium voltage-gated channel protein Shaw [Biomphalaria glabrata]